MGQVFSAAARRGVSGLFAVVFAIGMMFSTLAPASADRNQPTINAEKYVPTIWVDPDGCEHWVFDDGWEGYMTPHVTRDGRPVCRPDINGGTGNACATLNSDQLFASGRSDISGENRARLSNFFKKVQAKSFIIAGHTDNRGSDAYNMRLSERRASAVAKIALAAGVSIFDVRGYGERAPKASNKTAAGRAENRRVEIICVY